MLRSYSAVRSALLFDDVGLDRHPEVLCCPVNRGVVHVDMAFELRVSQIPEYRRHAESCA